MKLTESLAKRLKEVLTEGKWVIGTNIKEQIIDLDWKEAVQKIDSLNTIADLTFHISYYIAGLSIVLEGGTMNIRDKYSFDYPPIKSANDWRNLITKFCIDSERLIALVEKMDEDRLYETFFDEQYGNYLRNVNVLMEHAYYHFGQIVIIKKMIRGESKSVI